MLIFKVFKVGYIEEYVFYILERGGLDDLIGERRAYIIHLDCVIVLFRAAALPSLLTQRSR